MYAKIINNIIISYSKTEMPGGIYTTTQGLSGGMIVTAINGDEITAHLPVNKEQEVIDKVGRLAQINQELIQLGGTNELSKYTNFNNKRKARIEELKDEFEAIETDLTDNYEDTLVDDILDSLFS